MIFSILLYITGVLLPPTIADYPACYDEVMVLQYSDFFTTTLGGSSSEKLEFQNFDLLRISNRATRGEVLVDGLMGTWGHQLVVTHFVKVG